MSEKTEILDIYNDNFEHIGMAERKEIHKKGLWHQVVACQVFNPVTNKVVFQKKGDVHSPYSKIDITIGGHYQAGERPEDCVREIREELNEDISYDELIPVGIRQCAATVTQINQIINEFHRVFLLPRIQNLSEYKLNGEEVGGLVEIDIDDTISILLKKVDRVKGKILYIKDGKHVTEQIEIKLDDFIECWRIKDEFLLGLIIACKRYINGDDRELIRW